MGSLETGDQLARGTRVQVRNQFDGSWCSGFEVCGVRKGGRYQLRRLSDGSVLPVGFAADDVRVDPRRLLDQRPGASRLVVPSPTAAAAPRAGGRAPIVARREGALTAST